MVRQQYSLVAKQPSAGIYPVCYTLWEKGTYEVSVFSATTLVLGSSYTVKVANGAPQALLSSALGIGLEVGIAGEESLLEVRIRDRRQSKIPSIRTSAGVIEFINEKQRLEELSHVGKVFQIEFQGQITCNIEVGLSTLSDVVDALEALHTIGQVSVLSDGSSVIHKGDKIDDEFLTEHGTLDLMRSTELESITKILERERHIRQVIYCDADGGYIVLSFKSFMTAIEFDDDIDSVTSKLSILFGEPVLVVNPDDSVTTICAIAGKVVSVYFLLKLGNLEPVRVSFNACDDGDMIIFGNGEEHQGAANGTSPIMGNFKITHDGATTTPIRADATAEEVKAVLENLPSIGSLSMAKDMFGLDLRMDGQNIYLGTVSLFSI